jgi:hypothetical protein
MLLWDGHVQVWDISWDFVVSVGPQSDNLHLGYYPQLRLLTNSLMYFFQAETKAPGAILAACSEKRQRFKSIFQRASFIFTGSLLTLDLD